VSWKTVSLTELSKEEPERKDRGHSFIRPKRIPWLSYCRYCGHVPLKNEISVLVTRIGCAFERDQRYLAMRPSTTLPSAA
jgi:hypothetical protein